MWQESSQHFPYQSHSSREDIMSILRAFKIVDGCDIGSHRRNVDDEWRNQCVIRTFSTLECMPNQF